MVFPLNERKVVHSLKLSSVGPSKVTGADVVQELSPMDIAMKLHYLTGLYYFTTQAAQGVTISSIKEAMFEWLNTYYVVCGRLKRWPETGRPYIKCNDCGVRFIEAVCDNTLQEWLSENQDRNLLIYHQVIGPEISFSPPCLIQITQFKCGGMSLGLSWAHVLGDAIAAIDFINMWAQFLAGPPSSSPKPCKPIITTPESTSPSPCEEESHPVSLKRVDPVGDHWSFNSHNNMKTFSFHVTHPLLMSHISLISGQIPTIFESLCVVLWKLIAEARRSVVQPFPPPNVITICKNDSSCSSKGGGGLSNNNNNNSRLKVSVVKGEVGLDPTELLGLLRAQLVVENEAIEEAVERSNGLGDFIVYGGGNLTFVDLTEAELYGLEMNGVRPVFAEYGIQGVGKEGAVIVAPGPHNNYGSDVVVTMVMPEEQIPEIKHILNINNLI